MKRLAAAGVALLLLTGCSALDRTPDPVCAAGHDRPYFHNGVLYTEFVCDLYLQEKPHA